MEVETFQSKDGYAVCVVGETNNVYYLYCKVTELFEEGKKSDFAAFVRFKGIHYVSDNLKDFFNQVEEIKLIAK